jgi:carbon starvation protein CstA
LFLFAAWDLLRQYPDEGVNRSLFTILTALFGSGSLLVVLINLLAVAEKVQKYLWQVFQIIDLTTSTVGLLLIGWQLQKSLGSNMKTKNLVLKATVPWMTFIAYFIWASSQPLHYWLKEFSWYSALLLTSTLAAVIMTIILCSQALEEKPEYSSNRESG